MRDPMPINEKDGDKYWMTRMENNLLLEEFQSKEKFRNKEPTRNISLENQFSGNAHVIYGGRFYYADESGRGVYAIKLDDLHKAYINLEIPPRSKHHRGNGRKQSRHVRSHRGRRTASGDHLSSQHLYSNQLNRIDISADENGVWLVMGDVYGNTNHTIVLKISETFKVEYAWNLTLNYHEVGDTFILCGVLYGVESLTTMTSVISFAYDLYDHKELTHLEKIEFTNPFSGTKYIGYNSLYQYLYTWDNGNILEYKLKIDSNAATKEKEEEE